MPKLPVLRPKELIRALEKLGFLKRRQKGSHLVMVHEEKNKQIIIPVHNKPLKKGTIAAILRQADISPDDL
ncbi:type II toxin-antitoxin system HicA family toxin [Patescibacteria group bacterium]|nr:type II toxin-antitoxin system HicA family toxin [Patescibacteria group bacterium]MBU1703725.1 type II toxin-antitoxin system HicA family toxin [Patescibacteria group bacterium]MBU1953624.1 type II toxin-antitoxin system HicA family toxin [Patescibacteria group bacterium]